MVWRALTRKLWEKAGSNSRRLDTVDGLKGRHLRTPFCFGAPGRAHLLGGGSPLLARQGEALAEWQGCRGRLRIFRSPKAKRWSDEQEADTRRRSGVRRPMWWNSGASHMNQAFPTTRCWPERPNPPDASLRRAGTRPGSGCVINSPGSVGAHASSVILQSNSLFIWRNGILRPRSQSA